jgi:hypothetical protein
LGSIFTSEACFAYHLSAFRLAWIDATFGCRTDARKFQADALERWMGEDTINFLRGQRQGMPALVDPLTPTFLIGRRAVGARPLSLLDSAANPALDAAGLSAQLGRR